MLETTSNMDNLNVNPVAGTAKYWYLPLITGIILILIGVWVFRTPLASYITLAMLFSVTFLMTGIIEMMYAIFNRKEIYNWGWSLANGIIDFLIGVLLISKPQMSMVILSIHVGFGIFFRSIVAISLSIEIKRQMARHWSTLLYIGISGSIFSFILLLNPLFAGMTLVIYTALSFIIIGIFQVYLSIGLRKIKKVLQ